MNATRRQVDYYGDGGNDDDGDDSGDDDNDGDDDDNVGNNNNSNNTFDKQYKLRGCWIELAWAYDQLLRAYYRTHIIEHILARLRTEIIYTMS